MHIFSGPGRTRDRFSKQLKLKHSQSQQQSEEENEILTTMNLSLFFPIVKM